MTTLIVGKHAAERATERFGISTQSASQWIRGMYAGSRYVSDITSDDGNRARLFVNDGVAIVLDMSVDKVITVYKPVVPSAVKTEMAAVVKRKLAAADRKERAVERHVRVEKAKLSVELANCNLRMELTPSKAVINRNSAIAAEINAKIAQLDTEMADARREKAHVVRGLAAYM